MMSKAFFVLLLSLCALIAVCEARPIVYMARLTDTNVNATNGQIGVSSAYVTITKGRLSHRLRVFVGHSIINDTVTGAWLAYANGTKVAALQISPSVSQGAYAYGDVRVNVTVYDALLAEHNNGLYVIVYTERFPNGAIGGEFRARPNTGVCIPSAAAAGSTSTALGFAYTYIADPENLPLDLIQQTDLLLNNATFDAQIIANITGATGASFNGPANSTSVAPVLAPITQLATFGGFSITGFQPVTSDFFAQQIGLTYVVVTSAAFPAGELRCQVLPTLGRTRRIIPVSAETVTGETSALGGFGTLRFANQQDNERNDASFISLIAQQTNGTGNYTYQAFFRFPSAASRRNFDNVRGLVLELNVRQFGDAVWNFDYFDATTGSHVPTATFSTPGLWTPGFANYVHHDAHTFTNNRKELVVRVTVDTPTPSTLWVDLFAIRSYEPTAATNQFIRTATLISSLLPLVDSEDS
jgi:hypothetical protein